MDVLLINPPYLTITARVGVGHQVPLGLLMVGGPLIDAGHRVRLLDAECERMSIDAVVRRVVRLRPDVVMTGHAGSTPAHPVCIETLRAIKAALPEVVTVYGGVYPTYHAAETLRAEPSVDVVVRGEGEATGVELVAALDGWVRTTLEPSADTAPGSSPSTPNGTSRAGDGAGPCRPGADRVRASDRASAPNRRGASCARPGPARPGSVGPANRPLSTDSDARLCVPTGVAASGMRDRASVLRDVHGIAFRDGAGDVVVTPDRAPIANLDACRTAWELIPRWDRYHCFGLGRAAIVQLSRGCPHRCTYCGQHGFWVKWRHRDPVRLADQIEHLSRAHRVRFVTLADENPTTLKPVWRRFLEELARRRLPVHLFATIRATDIVRDADLLPLYRAAGVLYVLMGIESTSDAVLRDVRKGSTTRHDYRACRLLKQHGIFSILGHIVGLEDETPATFRRARRQLAAYDGDYVNAMYVTPHDWTPFGHERSATPVIEADLRKWDYRHQVLAQRFLSPWRVFAHVKWLELCFHLRPRRLWAIATCPDRLRQRQLLWCALHTGLVWVWEVGEFVARSRRGRQARVTGHAPRSTHRDARSLGLRVLAATEA